MSKSKQLEDDVMHALESLRAMLDEDRAREKQPEHANIPTLNSVVERPSNNEAIAPSLFDNTDAPATEADEKPAEEQLTIPQVSESDNANGLSDEGEPNSTEPPSFDDFWAILEPKLKAAAQESFEELLNPTKKS